MTNKKLKKVLIIRFSSIGDIVLTTPVIRGVKLQLGAEVHFLTKKSFESLLSANPYLDKIYTIDKKVGEVMLDLKKEKYDAVIDLHKNLRSMQVRWGLRVPYFTFDKINWEKWLMVNFKIDRLPKVHIVERYMKAVEKLKVQYDGKGLDPPTLQSDSKRGEGSIVFAIGGAHATKRLPVEKMISICKGIKSPIILLGGKEDAEAGDQIVKALLEEDLLVRQASIQNLCGKTTLIESAEIIKNARKVITHDTGMMHIAAAYKKEIISIWGNTIPEFGMHPFYQKNVNNNVSIEVKNLSCRPCSKIGFEKCPKGHFKCMMEIDIEEIISRQ